MLFRSVMGLEAIYADTNEFHIALASKFQQLQQHIENWQLEDGDEHTLLQNVVRHPPISFTLQMIINGFCQGSEIEIAACLLLQVTISGQYPLDEKSLPDFQVKYFMATDREAVCNPDKPLESLAYLEENMLTAFLKEEARHILPDPCVYEVIHSCLQDRLFEFVRINVRAQHLK